MTADRLRQLARGLGALGGLVLLVAGVPVALVILAGWPLPHSLPNLDAIREALEQGWSPDGIVVLKALAVVCWVAWAELAACTTVEFVAALRGRRPVKVPLAGPLQPLIAHLVAVVLLALTPAAATGSTAPSAPSLTTAVARYSAAVPALRLTAEEKPLETLTSASPAIPEPAGPKQVVVRPRDNLWDLAERHLGNPLRWREIWELNRSRLQPDGRPLTNPNLIRSGWSLLLPPDAVGVDGQAKAPAGTPAPSVRAAPAPTVPSIDSSAPSSPGVARVPEPSLAARDKMEPGPIRETGARPPDAPNPIRLPSGSTVAASFAAGVAAAVATGRLRRRRSYRPSPPGSAVLAPPPDLGPTVQTLLRGAAPTPVSDATEISPDPEDPSPSFAYTGLNDPEPARLPIGVRAGRPVELELTALGGLGLDGPGAPDVVRAIVAGLAAKGRACVTELLVPEPTARSLLPGADAVAGIRLTADLDGAVTEAEVELIRRTRLLALRDAEDFAAYRQACPEDLLPALVLVVDEVSDRHSGRVQAVAELGARLGVGVVVRGAQGPTSVGIHVDGQGTACAVSPGSLATEFLDVSLHRLTEAEFREVLDVLGGARQEETVAAEGVQRHDMTDRTGVAKSDATDANNPEAVAVPTPGPAQTVTMPVAGALVQVRLLGPYRIEAGGDELRTGLRSAARELLAFYLLRSEGASIEAAADALWPEVELGRASERFWTALGNLRSRIRQATGVDQPLIEKEGERYRVQPGVFDVDLWHFQDALAEARRRSSDDDAGESALTRAGDAYGGELLEGSFYEWAEPTREDVRRRALDALVRLANLRTGRGDTEGALTAIEQAIRVDPYAEELYRQAVVLLGQLDRVDVARQLFRQLGARLADLDADPEDETVRLVNQLSAIRTSEKRARVPRAG